MYWSLSLSVTQQDGEMLFSEELFLDHKSSSMRQFLQSAVHLQFFKQVNNLPHAGDRPLLDRYCNYNTKKRRLLSRKLGKS